MIQAENRERLLEFLDSSTISELRSVLQCRTLTNTTLFSPAQSAAGQPWEAALALSGLLLHEHRLKPALHGSLAAMAAEAIRGGNSQRFEQALLDLMSLGQRFNWLQLVAFVAQIEDIETLRHLAYLAQKADARLPVLFSAVQLSGRPADVAKYLADFSQTGLKDAGASLRFGAGGLNELLRRDQRLHSSAFQRTVAGYDSVRVVFPFRRGLLLADAQGWPWR